MAQDGNLQNQAPSRTWTWPLGGARPRSGAARPRTEFAVPSRVREWLAEEASAGRLFPWSAVAFGLGIVVYFTADHEPVWWAPAGLAAAFALAAVLLRRQAVAFVVALALCGMSAGFAVAALKTALIKHPVLGFPASGVTITGFVELREESQHTDRFVLRVQHIEGKRLEQKPERVRLTVKRGMAPPAGSFVEVKAYLRAAAPAARAGQL